MRAILRWWPASAGRVVVMTPGAVVGRRASRISQAGGAAQSGEGPKGVACISLSFDYNGETVGPLNRSASEGFDLLARTKGATFDNVNFERRCGRCCTGMATWVGLDRRFRLVGRESCEKRFGQAPAPKSNRSEMFSYEQVDSTRAGAL